MFDRLEEAILTVPIPGAPPKLSTTGARIGLAFLDIALQQNHTRRITEELTLNDVGVANRVIRQEISLSLLKKVHYEACARYASYRMMSSTVAHGNGGSFAGEAWVPLARVSRISSPPVRVLDSNGTALPTLTRTESAELFAPAIYRLFRQVIETLSADRSGDSARKLIAVEHEARWLLQQAIIELITGKAPAMGTSGQRRTEGTELATGGIQRRVLLDTLRQPSVRKDLAVVLRFLQIAVDEQVLIAEVDNTRSDHELTYVLPIAADSEPGDTKPRRRLSLPRRSGDYVIQYSTVIPSGVKSYHLTASTVDPNAEMSDAALVVSAPEERTAQISENLQYLESVMVLYHHKRLDAAETKLFEYEAQNTLKALAEIIRRRKWQAEWHRLALNEAKLRACLDLAHAAISGEGNQPHSAKPLDPGQATTSGQQKLPSEPRVQASVVQHPLVTTANLKAAAQELRDADLGCEIVMGARRESTHANLFWRRSELDLDGRHDLAARCHLRITDGAAEGVGNIRIFGLTLFLITYLVFAGSYQSIWPWQWGSHHDDPTDVEAKVAILLLVPGFLFTRLELPPRNTILAKLRQWPRLLAHVYIATSLAAAISLACAANPATRTVASCLIILIQILLQLAILPHVMQRSTAMERRVPLMPRWLTPDKRTILFRRPDSAFVAVGQALDT